MLFTDTESRGAGGPWLRRQIGRGGNPQASGRQRHTYRRQAMWLSTVDVMSCVACCVLCVNGFLFFFFLKPNLWGWLLSASNFKWGETNCRIGDSTEMNRDKNAAICKDVVPTVAVQFFSSHGKHFSWKRVWIPCLKKNHYFNHDSQLLSKQRQQDYFEFNVPLMMASLFSKTLLQ